MNNNSELNINNIDDFFKDKTMIMRIVEHTVDLLGVVYIGTENSREFFYLRQSIAVYKLPVSFDSIQPGENYYLEKERFYEFLDIMFKDYHEDGSEINFVKEENEWRAILKYVSYIKGRQYRNYIYTKASDRVYALNSVLTYTTIMKNLYLKLKKEFEENFQEKNEALVKHLTSSNPIIQIHNEYTINSFPLFPNSEGKLDEISEELRNIDGFVFENDNEDLGEKGLYVRELNGIYRLLSDEATRRLVSFIKEEYMATLKNMGLEYNTKCICKKTNALVWQTKMWFGIDRKFAVIGYGTGAKGDIDSVTIVKNKTVILFCDYLP